MDICTDYLSPLGQLTLAARGEALIGAWFRDQARFGCGLSPEVRAGTAPVLTAASDWLDRYFAGMDPGPTPPLAPNGSPFCLAVWPLLAEIPYGETVTYGQLAARLSQRQGGRIVSPRAVGGAVGRNPLSLFLPCHRVVGAGGRLTGYAGGLARKAALLALEQEGLRHGT